MCIMNHLVFCSKLFNIRDNNKSLTFQIGWWKDIIKRIKSLKSRNNFNGDLYTIVTFFHITNSSIDYFISGMKKCLYCEKMLELNLTSYAVSVSDVPVRAWSLRWKGSSISQKKVEKEKKKLASLKISDVSEQNWYSKQ